MKTPRIFQILFSGLGEIGRGMSKITLFPTNHYKDYEEMFGTDEERLASDWKKVGDDLRKAMKKFERRSR